MGPRLHTPLGTLDKDWDEILHDAELLLLEDDDLAFLIEDEDEQLYEEIIAAKLANPNGLFYNDSISTETREEK